MGLAAEPGSADGGGCASACAGGDGECRQGSEQGAGDDDHDAGPESGVEFGSDVRLRCLAWRRLLAERVGVHDATALQLPSFGSHSSVCSPGPLVEATQKSWSPRGDAGASPARFEYSGFFPMSVTMERSTPFNYPSTSVAVAIPTKTWPRNRSRCGCGPCRGWLARALAAAEVHVGAVGDDRRASNLGCDRRGGGCSRGAGVVGAWPRHRRPF